MFLRKQHDIISDKRVTRSLRLWLDYTKYSDILMQLRTKSTKWTFCINVSYFYLSKLTQPREIPAWETYIIISATSSAWLKRLAISVAFELMRRCAISMKYICGCRNSLNGCNFRGYIYNWMIFIGRQVGNNCSVGI